MSDEPIPSSAIPVPSSEPTTDTIPLKPLPTPVQSGIQPSSTRVEPPRTPNPTNTATDDKGDAVPPAVASEMVTNGHVEAVTNGGSGLDSGPTTEPITTPQEDPSLPPLPQDAPVPPSPKAADEPPPVLPVGAIPPPVSTPTVIVQEDPLQPNGVVDSNGVVEPSPTPVTEAPVISPAPAVSDAMEVDPVHSLTQPGLEASSSSQSLKRAGEELEGREEKRAREDQEASLVHPPAPTPQLDASQLPPAPTPPVTAPSDPEPVASTSEPVLGAPVSQPSVTLPPAAPVPVNVVPNFEPPPPEPAGPTTPLTLTQHKHLLNAVRSLKKNPISAPFLNPVDHVLFNIPTYPTIITKPMDLGTVEVKLIVSDPRGPPKDKSKLGKWDETKGKYGNVQDVVLDVRQIWWNTTRFNGVEHAVTQNAYKLAAQFDKALAAMPAEPVAIPPPQPSPVPVAGPSAAIQRRASVSQPPIIRRTSDSTDRPKREIHPPPSKDLAYAEVPGSRKPKRRNDPQLQWASKTIKQLESANKTYPMIAPFLYPVEKLIESLSDYASVIKKPIDLNQIKTKLDEGIYDGIEQLDQDMQLMIKNAMTYNNPQDDVGIAARQLQQLWNEKMKQVPPKQDPRDVSEDPIAASIEAESEEEEDDGQLAELEAQLADIQAKIDALKARKAKARSSKPAKTKSKKSSSSQPRKMSKASPGLNGSSGTAPKKPRKSKDVGGYKDYDEEGDDEDNTPIVTTAQKEELAAKIQESDPATLQKAIDIIQSATQLGSDGGEIELDIDSLPAHIQIKLYNLVCKPAKKISGPRKPAAVGKKPGRKPGVPRRSMNEEVEADRIRRMEAQLQSFNGGATSMGGGAYEGEDSESSEEEDSDEE